MGTYESLLPIALLITVRILHIPQLQQGLKVLYKQDYYLLAHSDYAAGYQELQTLVVGDLLTIDKALPNDATSSLNAGIITDSI